MNSDVRKGVTRLMGLAAAALLALPLAIGAQQVEDAIILRADDPNQEDLVLPTRQSMFELQAFGDEGSAGFRGNGSNSYCIQNFNGFNNRFSFGCQQSGLHNGNSGWTTIWFEKGMAWAAPPSDMPDVIDASVVKGSCVTAGCFTANMTTLIIGGAVKGGGDKLWSSDRSSAELMALGVKGTADATCTDFTSLRDGNLDEGFQLTPVNDCPVTIPATGWGGRHPIEQEAYLELQATHPDFQASLDNDPFAFWRVPEELQRTDKFLGNSATYGELSDFYLQALGRYGAVIPGGSGDPTYEGWPLGLTLFYDAFYFGLPSVGHSLFWQATIVNESEKVYGVGVEYDSVYIGINFDPLLNGRQADAHYFDSRRSAVVHQDPGAGTMDCSRVGPGTTGCPATGGWENGFSAASIMVLKSPIGDQRYKLFSDPESEFFDPSHPLAGDTITIQHQRQCGFGGCIPNTWSRSQRAHFGWWSSTGDNVLDGRSAGDLADRSYNRIFRPEFWPDRVGRNGVGGEFNKYVPGLDDGNPVWDWNHDGIADTIYADACGTRGCVALYADTAPSGWANGYGNISGIAVGPVHMAPGDTVPLVVALLAGADSATMESQMDNAISFYQGFFLGPESAPGPTITAVDVVPGGSRDNSVTLFLDDTTEEWEDPFLLKLDVSGDATLNPWLPDSIQSRIDDGVAAIHIFKSCDQGNSFTTDNDCDGDPVTDPTSKWGPFGWQPLVSFDAEDGAFPNQWTDENVIPGTTVTYSIVTETRGATFNLVQSLAGTLVANQVEFAPALLSPLSASATNPNVTSVYAPLNLAAGASRATLDTVAALDSAAVPININLVGTSPVGGQYRVVFADSLMVTQVDALDESGATLSSQTSVTGMVLRTVTGSDGSAARAVIESFDFDRGGTVSVQGLAQESVDETATQRTTVWAGQFGLVVAQGSTPFLASTTLDGDETTPGEFFGRADFPFFVVNVDAGDGGTFNEQTYVDDLGFSIAGNVVPSVQWSTGTNESAPLGTTDFGRMTFTWQQDAFGGRAPFRINDRANVEADLQAALAGRTAALTSTTDPELLDVVKAADPDVTLDAADLQSYELPFTVQNTTHGRTMQVLVTDHQEDILIGQAEDSLRVDVPDGVWVPGDVMYLIETVDVEVTDDNGNTVLGSNGQPQTESRPLATFKAVLGCQTPRLSCDPTIGGRLNSGYVPFRANFLHRVDYFVPLAGGDEMVFSVTPAVTTDEVTGEPDISGVHVVPNPYLFANEFERATADRVLRFTNLPPAGRIRIYDIAGRFVQEINYVSEDLRGGDLDWNMQTRESLELAAGLFVFVVETPGGSREMGKFVVIR